jgi:hypothetical protein
VPYLREIKALITNKNEQYQQNKIKIIFNYDLKIHALEFVKQIDNRVQNTLSTENIVRVE